MIRTNPITGVPVILATERASRPNAFGNETAASSCPFCPGREHETPSEISRAGEPWQLRLVPNKYPASPGHEVLVESPEHGRSFDQLTLQNATAAVSVYRERYVHLAPSAGYVAVFKNHGIEAGASIPHIHSQILPVPFVPPRQQEEQRGFESARNCPLCAETGIVIAGSESFRWIAPYASGFAYQQWIVPRTHVSSIESLTAFEELAVLLQRASKAMLTLSASYNWTFMNFAGPRTHWYIELLPRMTTMAGFELGTHSAINIVDPESAAGILRER